ncbi:MAG: hydroxylamine reductase [Bacilli bacterium]|jgi:hydroxylamine reductase|nr:hydroxylamine reductase [Bacilli bacterium]
MFCFQCQEAANNRGCTIKGVCGKSEELCKEMDLLKHHLKQLAVLNNDEIALFVTNSLFKLITNANFNLDDLKNTNEEALNIAKKYNLQLDNNIIINDNLTIKGLKEMIMTGLMGMAAYHYHAIQLNYQDSDIHEFMLHVLSKLDTINDIDKLLKIIDVVGEYGFKVMALLDEANTSTYGNPEISEVNIGVSNRPGILVSGHDLHDLKLLLEQSKDSGIDIYTHCEMLPAHYYPELKKYPHLRGNYGNAWYAQTKEFESFNGPILFTTNCIVPPLANANYKDHLFSTGNANATGFTYIPEINKQKDFSQIIELAKTCLPPKPLEEGKIIGGFAHHQVLALAEKIIENIKNGSIKKFVVMAGCDGRQANREYYTDFASKLANDTIILTAGCAKYRYNKLNLGSINGIPRVLDAGQCNDSYSLVKIALALKDAFELDDVNDLPIAYNIAWYEQKAVIVLLTLLHLGIKNIKLGPTLPAFCDENIVKVLQDKYQITTINKVNEDLEILG